MNLTRHNYEEYFLLYVDGELAADERLTVEAFLAEHQDLAEQLEDLQRAVLSPEETFSFDKDLVYRFAAETPSKVVPLTTRKLSWAAAAVVVGIAAGSLWLLKERVGPQTHPVNPPVAALGSRSETGGTKESGPATAGVVPTNPATGSNAPVVPVLTAPADRTLKGSGASAVTPKDTNPTVSGSGHPDNDPGTSATPLLQSTAIAQLTETHPGTFIPQGSVAGGPGAVPDIVNKVPATVTTQAPPSYHTIEDGDQEAGGDKILFVQADQVVNGEVKGFFRRAGRLIKRSASFNTDNVHPDSGTDK